MKLELNSWKGHIRQTNKVVYPVSVFCMWNFIVDIRMTFLFADTSVLEGLPPDSAEAQARITEIQNDDGFNWG